MSLPRIVQNETLDHLSQNDPRAIHSRRDLQRLNRIMGSKFIMLHALQHAERQGAWLSVGPIRPGIRVAQTETDLFLIGNAAAEAHPIIGEGISMAMQSAWLLCDKLLEQGQAQGQGVTAETYRRTRSAYIKEWQRNFASRVRLAALFAHLAMRPYLSSGALAMLQRWPSMLTYGAQLSGKARSLYSRQWQGEVT